LLIYKERVGHDKGRLSMILDIINSLIIHFRHGM